MSSLYNEVIETIEAALPASSSAATQAGALMRVSVVRRCPRRRCSAPRWCSCWPSWIGDPVDAIVVAGDVVGGPLPREALERLNTRRAEGVHWIRGNSEHKRRSACTTASRRLMVPRGEPPLGVRTHSIDAGVTHSPAGRSR